MNKETAWLALIISLPTRNATVRMRVWRSLKSLGCGVLRDGVYLLPEHASVRDALAAEAWAVTAAGGSAHLVEIAPADAGEDAAWRSLFDRTADYGRVVEKLRALRGSLKQASASSLARKFSGLRRNLDDITRIDFFPGEAREQATALIDSVALELEAILSPGEPGAVMQAIPQLRREDFHGRRWATRRRPWVDRLASAWLIARHIDAAANFVWLADPSDCPADAIGFDFDGARFTHVGNRVTFEVLLAAFGLESDAALVRIGGIVHYLDAGGVPPDDAAGVNTMLLGARTRSAGDDALLTVSMTLFDFLHSAYQEDSDDGK